MKSTALLAALLACAGALHAQQKSAAVPVTLGQSAVSLYGPWKFSAGDSPVDPATHVPLWAEPDFDDSKWETVDLTPSASTSVRGVPIAGFVSGWTARGHAGYAGFAWYRIRLRIQGTDGPLQLLAPEDFDAGFQVFGNGRLIGSFGNFNRPRPELYFGDSNTDRYSLTSSEYQSGRDGTLLLAFRFYMGPRGLMHEGTGGMHEAPILGLPAAANATWHMQWERRYRRLASSLATALAYFVFALLIAMIFAFNRAETVLLLPLSACVLQVVYDGLIFSTTVPWISEMPLAVLLNLAESTGWGFWLITWWAYFGLKNHRRLLRIILVLAVWNLVASEFFTIVLLVGKASHGFLIAIRFEDISTGIINTLVMAAIAYLGWKRKRGERWQWPLFLALFFYALEGFEPAMELLHLRTSWQPFGVILPLSLVFTSISLFFFSFVLLRQFRNSQRRLQAMEDDVKQAQEIQQLLIPEHLPALAGWTIESEYRPARQVGGDFFQIIPNNDNDSLLIVAGDVTGKGLQAGMLVAVLVGSIRTESAHTSDPVKILNALNTRLKGRERAQATCLALHVQADGSATLANAGHIAPYLNGEPLPMEGALPLGMIEDAEFSVMHFQLKNGDMLMLMSDGISEATDSKGNLFGFERVRELLRTANSAVAVADAAQTFGQEDDISVISVARSQVREPSIIGQTQVTLI
jgi:hypothetical protein